jgi:FtsZ-interacting cell division protein ZipA
MDKKKILIIVGIASAIGIGLYFSKKRKKSAEAKKSTDDKAKTDESTDVTDNKTPVKEVSTRSANAPAPAPAIKKTNPIAGAVGIKSSQAMASASAIKKLSPIGGVLGAVGNQGNAPAPAIKKLSPSEVRKRLIKECKFPNPICFKKVMDKLKSQGLLPDISPASAIKKLSPSEVRKRLKRECKFPNPICFARVMKKLRNEGLVGFDGSYSFEGSDFDQFENDYVDFEGLDLDLNL